MKKAFVAALFLLLVATRFYYLSWGQPYPFHPDEGQIMAPAVDRLTCDVAKVAAFNTHALQECLNPHFFAYGQFPLYLAAIIKLFTHNSVIALRAISATSSVLAAFVMFKMLRWLFSVIPQKKQLSEKEKYVLGVIAAFIIIFSPYAIQASHFGTTESLLMLFYTLLTYLAIYFFENKGKMFSYIFWSALVVGLSISTKISAVSFSALPGLIIFYIHVEKINFRQKAAFKKVALLIRDGLLFIALTLFITLITAPHNFLSYHEALNQIMYEISIGKGSYIPFYTQQFADTIPFVFQAIHIFPYTHSALALLGLLGIIFLPWSASFNILRLAFFLYLIPSGLLFAKWTRFLSPIFPLLTIFGIMMLVKLYQIQINSQVRIFLHRLILGIIAAFIILQGIAFMSVYNNEDVRFQASAWIVKNIPPQSYILSEARNIADGPVYAPGIIDEIPSYRFVSFNFYEVDTDPILEENLQSHLEQADYIFVPSRRVFANYTCWRPDGVYHDSSQEALHNGKKAGYCARLKKQYPVLNSYYEELFKKNGKYELTQTATSFPHISLFGKTLLSFPDEWAEETWSVFDHPVIRIYKKRGIIGL